MGYPASGMWMYMLTDTQDEGQLGSRETSVLEKSRTLPFVLRA